MFLCDACHAAQVDPEVETPRTSPPDVLAVLHRFAVAFLDRAFNLLMPVLYKLFATPSDAVMPYDEVHFVQLFKCGFFFPPYGFFLSSAPRVSRAN